MRPRIPGNSTGALIAPFPPQTCAQESRTFSAGASSVIDDEIGHVVIHVDFDAERDLESANTKPNRSCEISPRSVLDGSPVRRPTVVVDGGIRRYSGQESPQNQCITSAQRGVDEQHETSRSPPMLGDEQKGENTSDREHNERRNRHQ